MALLTVSKDLSIAADYRTLAAAKAAATGADTVRVLDSSDYGSDRLEIEDAQDGIIYELAPGARPIVGQGGSYSAFWAKSGAANWTVRGGTDGAKWRFRGTSGSGGCLYIEGGSGATLTDWEILDGTPCSGSDPALYLAANTGILTCERFTLRHVESATAASIQFAGRQEDTILRDFVAYNRGNNLITSATVDHGVTLDRFDLYAKAPFAFAPIPTSTRGVVVQRGTLYPVAAGTGLGTFVAGCSVLNCTAIGPAGNSATGITANASAAVEGNILHKWHVGGYGAYVGNGNLYSDCTTDRDGGGSVQASESTETALFRDETGGNYRPADDSPAVGLSPDTGAYVDRDGEEATSDRMDAGAYQANIAGSVAPTLNVVSATPAGPLSLVVLFDRPPAGAVLGVASYTVAPDGDYAAVAVAAVALGDPEPGATYPVSVVLTFEVQGKGGEAYTLTVAGLTGPAGEALGTASAGFTAAATAPRVTTAVAATAAIEVGFSLPMDEATIGAAEDWTLAGDVDLPTITGVSLLAGGLTVSLAITGDVLDGTTVTAPATIADPAANVVDSAHDDALVLAGLSAPEPSATDGQGTVLWATLNGQPLADPWSFLPDDPLDADEVAGRIIICALGTDKRVAEDVARPDPEYRGGAWLDPWAPDLPRTRTFTLLNAPQTDDTLARARQYLPEDLAAVLALLGATGVTADAEFQGNGLAIAINVQWPDRDDLLINLGVR